MEISDEFWFYNHFHFRYFNTVFAVFKFENNSTMYVFIKLPFKNQLVRFTFRFNYF